MAEIVTQNPGSTEVQSPLIAGMTEGLRKLSLALNLKEETFQDVRLESVYIDNEPENQGRIFEIPFGKKLWLMNPAPVIKRNGIEITQEQIPFVIDYVGGSITFQKSLRSMDVITASASYITGNSTTLNTIANIANQVEQKSQRYKGYFENEKELSTQFSEGKDGDIAFVANPQFALYSWDKAQSKWRNTQSIEDLTKYYTKSETDDFLNEKEPNISPKGIAASDDRFYYGGRKTWQDFDATTRTVPLTGLQVGSKEPVAPTDTILQAMGKLAGSAKEVREKGYIEGTGEPTASTVGKVGQRYVNTSTGKWYTCISAVSDTYEWEEGNSIETVQTTGESTTAVMSQKAVTDELGKKVNAELGKGLSTNDFTTSEKEKLAGLQNYDDAGLKELLKSANSEIAKKADKFKSFVATVPASGWSAAAPYTQTITVDGMDSSGLPLYDLQSYNEEAMNEFAKITKLETQVGSIIVTAQKDKPSADIILRIEVLF